MTSTWLDRKLCITVTTDACRKHGKWPGMGGAYSEELLSLYIGKGMKFILAGNDLPMLTGAARAHQAKVRAMR